MKTLKKWFFLSLVTLVLCLQMPFLFLKLAFETAFAAIPIWLRNCGEAVSFAIKTLRVMSDVIDKENQKRSGPTFIVPPGVSHLTVEMKTGGGGGSSDHSRS